MNLTTDFHLNLMKKEDTGLALLTTRVITLHGRSLLMIPTLSSSDLLSEVPPRHLQTSDWTHQKGEDQPQDLTSDVFVYGRPNPDGSDHTSPMSILNFDDLLGRTFQLPMDENGERKRATISEHVKDLYQDQVSREDQLRFKQRLMEINWMTSFHITNLWNT